MQFLSQDQPKPIIMQILHVRITTPKHILKILIFLVFYFLKKIKYNNWLITGKF